MAGGWHGDSFCLMYENNIPFQPGKTDLRQPEFFCSALKMSI